MKHICKRDLLRNPYKHISDEPLIGTQHGNPSLFVGKVDTVTNLNKTLNTLHAFRDSLTLDQSGSSPVGNLNNMADYTSINIQSSGMSGIRTLIDDQTNKPIIQKGGQITYEKHSHK